MYLRSIENPVTPVAMNWQLLQKSFDGINRNFNEIQMQMHSQQLRNTELQIINKHLTQLLNWIATTNPQILDEFQTTATAFDKLIPRDDGSGYVPSAQASPV
jgi:hypothetical protein